MRTSALADALAITAEAARQQLNRLVREGLVAPETEHGAGDAIKAGRPSQRWRLTPAAEARFPDAHAELTVRLIQTVRAELGEEALDRLVMAHERRARAAYATELSGAQSPTEKIARLAALRTRDGYMAEWHDLDGVWLLTENHCPICAAAQACQGFCRAELALFQEVLGPELEVTRTDHIASGARRCAYRIVESAGV